MTTIHSNTGTHARQHDEAAELVALSAEFETVDAVMHAAGRVRDAGFSRWDVHSPFPIHGIEKAMGIKPTLLPWVVFVCGLTGCSVGLLLVWYTNAVDYPYLISGKPIFSLPANIPVIFECTVLFSAFGAVFGMLGMNKLPLLYNPLFKSRRFLRATDDRFFIVIEAADPRFNDKTTSELLHSLGATNVERIED